MTKANEQAPELPAFQTFNGADQLQAIDLPTEAGDRIGVDPIVASMEAGNVARHLLEGGATAAWQWGVVVGTWLGRR